MQEIIAYSKEHPNLNVKQALDSLVQAFQTQNMQMSQMSQMSQMHPGNLQNQALLMQQMQQMQQGKIGPNGPMMGQRHGSEAFMNMSPAMQAGMLPANGSPHLSTGPNPMGINNANTSSPAQVHMAPPMVTQQSQQGNAVSNNTSPNVSGKRRRSTAAGIKGEDEGGEANGIGIPKVKPSPRMGSNSKRVKQG
jgi:hypothetical protein